MNFHAIEWPAVDKTLHSSPKTLPHTHVFQTKMDPSTSKKYYMKPTPTQKEVPTEFHLTVNQKNVACA